jgi:hypothetical protein
MTSRLKRDPNRFFNWVLAIASAEIQQIRDTKHMEGQARLDLKRCQGDLATTKSENMLLRLDILEKDEKHKHLEIVRDQLTCVVKDLEVKFDTTVLDLERHIEAKAAEAKVKDQLYQSQSRTAEDAAFWRRFDEFCNILQFTAPGDPFQKNKHSHSVSTIRDVMLDRMVEFLVGRDDARVVKHLVQALQVIAAVSSASS